MVIGNSMGPADNNNIYTVAKLTREIKHLLEDRFPFVWVTGEISNYVVPASGHAYFSLKDDRAVISCVMFRNQKRRLAFGPENGIKIVGMARLSLYEPRGAYQLIFEHLALDGAGALQADFEQLKQKLASQGLFDPAHKKKLPFLPSRISVITSGTGAAVRDIIHVATRRFPGCALEIVPVKVQGEDAPAQIIQALYAVNDQARSDLIILARGGGSLEDLWAFNSEGLARALFASELPVVTGIGHEIDFTIADFVADLRAPTPSAAAEMALPDCSALAARVQGLGLGLETAMARQFQMNRTKLSDLASRLKSPARVVDDHRFRLEELQARTASAMTRQIRRTREHLSWLTRALAASLTPVGIQDSKKQVHSLAGRLDQAMTLQLRGARSRLSQGATTLDALNPQSVLDRGYSIARDMATGRVIRDARQTHPDDRVEITLSKGRLVTRVEKNGQKNI